MDEDRLSDLYERYHRYVYAYCRRRTDAERANDALSETFLTAWRKLDDAPPVDEALPWLYAIAYRAIGHQWRTARRQGKLKQKLKAGVKEHIEIPEDYIMFRHESKQILKALARLKPKEQEILRLTVWEELNHREIAQILNISTDAAKKRSSRARKSLAREFTRIEASTGHPAARKGGAW